MVYAPCTNSRNISSLKHLAKTGTGALVWPLEPYRTPGRLAGWPGNSFLKPVSQAAVCRLENEIFKTKDGKRVAETTKGYGMNHNPFEIIGAEGQNRTADTGIFSNCLRAS